jgi:hypothetical protein
MNIDPAALSILQGNSTPPRKGARKQDDITPTPPRTAEQQAGSSTKRAQGPPKRLYKASSINAQDIAKFFTRKSAPTPPALAGQELASAASASTASTTLPATINTETTQAAPNNVANTTTTAMASATTAAGNGASAILPDTLATTTAVGETITTALTINSLAVTTVGEQPTATVPLTLGSATTSTALESAITTSEIVQAKNPTISLTSNTTIGLEQATTTKETGGTIRAATEARSAGGNGGTIVVSTEAIAANANGDTISAATETIIAANGKRGTIAAGTQANGTGIVTAADKARSITDFTTPTTVRKDVPDPSAVEIAPPPSIKLVPAGKTLYKRNKPKTPSKVLFSPTNEVRVMEQDNQVTYASVAAKDAPSTPETPTIHHKHKTVFEISVKINPNTEHVNLELRNQLLQTLSFIREWIDPDAAFLPKRSTTSLKPIVDKPSFPAVTYLLVSSYFHFASPSWFTATKERNKMVRLSAIMGLNVDPTEIELAKADINGFGVILTIKPHQDVETSSKLIFLGAPYAMSKHYAKQMMIKVFTAVEVEIKKDPDHEQQEMFVGDLPDFAVTITQPQNTYVEQAKGEKYVLPAKERRAIHIMCASRNYDRFYTLTMMAKGMDMWRPVFGLCYPTTTPDVNSEDNASTRYHRMVECHQLAQMCQDSFAISGLLRLDESYTLNKDDGSTATVSARKILSLIELFEPERDAFCKVFICAIQKDDKKFHAYYPGGRLRCRIQTLPGSSDVLLPNQTAVCN